MKYKLLTIIAAMAAVLGTAACNKAAEEENASGNMTLTLQPDQISVSAQGGQESFSFTAPDYWFASCPEKWINIDPYSGKEGSATVTFTVEANTETQERSAVITVNAKGQKGQVKVTQSAGQAAPEPPAGPDYSGTWTVIGTLDDSNWDKDFEMSSAGDLLWEATIPYRTGNEFKFRMDASDQVSLGISGDWEKDDEGVLHAALAEDGAALTLPSEGYWKLTLDVAACTVAAGFVEEFPAPEEPVETEGTVIWDEATVFDGWGCTIVIPAEKFASAAEGDIIRVYFKDKGSDYNPIFKHVGDWSDWTELQSGKEDADAYFQTVIPAGALAELQSEGLRFQGVGFTIVAVTLIGNSSPGGPDTPGETENSIWVNDDPAGHGSVSWNGTYRFGLEGHDGNNECIATLPQAVWDKLKTGPFYLKASIDNADWYNVRITNGWWDATVGDVGKGSDRIVVNGDGTFTLEIDLSEDADFVATLDEKHLLFTGEGYTPLELCFQLEDAPGDTGESIWENDDPAGHGSVSWNGTYRFGLEGHDGNNECIATLPQEVWDKMKTGTFYLVASIDDDGWYSVRITNGWWDPNWNGGDIGKGDERIVVNGDGTFTLAVNVSEDADFLSYLDDRNLLFTGSGYTPLKLYFQE